MFRERKAETKITLLQLECTGEEHDIQLTKISHKNWIRGRGDCDYFHEFLEPLLGRRVVVRPRQVLVDVIVDAEDGDVDLLELEGVLLGLLGILGEPVEHPVGDLPHLPLLPVPPLELLLQRRPDLPHGVGGDWRLER